MKKIALVGPESTGKTILAARLSDHYHEPWVREYAREYLQKLDRPYVLDDLVNIAKGQLRQERRAGQAADQYLFCDTNLLVIRIWAKDKFGCIPPEIESLWDPQEYDLHLLLYPDVPWEEDSFREDPARREALFSLYEEELELAQVSYAIIRGVGDERLKQACWALDL